MEERVQQQCMVGCAVVGRVATVEPIRENEEEDKQGDIGEGME